MFKQYIKYIKDNPKGYWFKAKWYGWGWTPVKWQGWVVVGLFVAFLIWNSTLLTAKGAEPDQQNLILYFGQLGIAMLILLFICYKKGEPPRWSWGKPKK